MPGDSVECLLGRMQQSIEDMRRDIAEVKAEQKRVADFITTQKAGYWFLTLVLTTIGSGIIAFHDEIVKVFGTKIPN